MIGFQKTAGSVPPIRTFSISSSHCLTRMSGQSCLRIFRVTELTRNPTDFATKREAIEALQGKIGTREYLR